MKLYGALEAGGTKMVLAIVNEDGELIERTSLPTRSPSETMPQMINFFQKSPVSSLGIGCFGPLDLNLQSKTYGHITATPKLAWHDYPILSAFQEALHIPRRVPFSIDPGENAVTATRLYHASCDRQRIEGLYR